MRRKEAEVVAEQEEEERLGAKSNSVYVFMLYCVSMCVCVRACVYVYM